MCDAIQLVFVELSKLKKLLDKPVSEMTVLDKWSLFLQYAPDRKHREKVNEVIESEEVLSVAGELLMSISQDERERAIFRSRRKFQTDYQSDIATAEDRGREAGKIAGRAAEKIEIARNMIADGEPVEKIVRYTGLTIEELKHLRTEI